MNTKASYNYCGICGHQPRTSSDEPNRAPIRWWDPDDGWKIGTLCRHCHEEFGPVKPKPRDYAYRSTSGIADDVNTDEDPIDVAMNFQLLFTQRFTRGLLAGITYSGVLRFVDRWHAAQWVKGIRRNSRNGRLDYVLTRVTGV